MRTLLALILSWLMPSTGKRRAADQTSMVSTADTADAPTQRLIITRSAVTSSRSLVGVERPARSPRPPAYLRGEDTPLIRPYLIAWEREQERQRLHRLQRDRRRAAVLATLGQDYPTLSLDIHGVTA